MNSRRIRQHCNVRKVSNRDRIMCVRDHFPTQQLHRKSSISIKHRLNSLREDNNAKNRRLNSREHRGQMIASSSFALLSSLSHSVSQAILLAHYLAISLSLSVSNSLPLSPTLTFSLSTSHSRSLSVCLTKVR